MKPDLTMERLKELLHFDPTTGVFTRRVKSSSGVSVGDIAGTLHEAGYRQISIDGKRYYAHRLAWLYAHGRWPDEQIDHVNGMRDDNRIANLREATEVQNKWNRKVQKVSTTGLKGVRRHRSKFQATIRIKGERIHLGIFETAEDAHAAYVAAANENFGEFARAS